MKILRDEVGDEVRKNPEPDVVYYSIEADEIYKENDDGGDTSLAAENDEQEDSDDEGGGVKFKMALLEEKKKVTELEVKNKELEREKEKKVRMLEELLAKHGINAEEEFKKAERARKTLIEKRKTEASTVKFDMGMLYR